jgi:hypothetical protein
MIKPDPRLLCLKSLGSWSPKNRSKNSLKGSFGPKGMGARSRPFITFKVLIFTTDGLAPLANSEKDPGVVPAVVVAWTSGVEMGLRSVDTPYPPMRQNNVQPMRAVFSQAFLFMMFSFILKSFVWE